LSVDDEFHCNSLHVLKAVRLNRQILVPVQNHNLDFQLHITWYFFYEFHCNSLHVLKAVILNRQILVPVQSHDLDFQLHITWYFCCLVIWCEKWLFVVFFQYWWNIWPSLFLFILGNERVITNEIYGMSFCILNF
jgi:hypothetical protein